MIAIGDQLHLNCDRVKQSNLSVCEPSLAFTFGTISGRSMFSQPAGRLELYQATEPIVTAAKKPTT
ncbi:MAG TPA: hypothetical protein V6C71_10495 [Coleofasciculaceae cyanobacterium]